MKTSIIIFSIIFFIAFFVYVYMFRPNINVAEEFNQIDGSKEIQNYDQFLEYYNIRDKAELESLLKGTYNEDLSYIYQNNMTLYYSVFSTESIRNLITRKWNNISPYFKTHTMLDCPSRNQYLYTHINLDKLTNSIEPDLALKTIMQNGISVKDTVMRGPLSHQLGIVPTNHSVFFLFSARILNNTTENSTLIQIFANNMKNNAFKLDIKGGSILFDTIDSYNVKFDLQYGDSIATSAGIDLKKDTIYLMAYTKNANSIDLVMHDMSTKNFIDIFQIDITSSTDKASTLSNKEIVLNNESNLDISLYALAIFNQPINDKMYIINYFLTEISKTTPEFRNMANAFFYAEDAKDKIEQCPYDTSTCAACSDVTNFNDSKNIILQGSEECKQLINGYCSSNIAAKGCECWSDLAKDNTSCAIFRSIFDGDDELCRLADEKKCFQKDVSISDTTDVEIKNKNCAIKKVCVDKYIKDGDWAVNDDYVLEYENISIL